MNADPAELEKFSKLAHRWWDPQGEFRPLHEINPLRLEWIDRSADLAGKKVLDVGCGGGILAEAMAQRGAEVTGIDLGEKGLRVAELHLLESKLPVKYEMVSAEDYAARHAAEFDVVTCMELLEHVPEPAAMVAARRAPDDNAITRLPCTRMPVRREGIPGRCAFQLRSVSISVVNS